MILRLALWVIIFLLGISLRPADAETSFAILPIEKRGDVPSERIEQTQNSLYQHLVDSKRYKIVDRARLEDLLKEQTLQLSGVTDPGTVGKVGKMLNVDKFIYTALTQREPQLFVFRCSVVDVQTGQIEFDREISHRGNTAADDGRYCAGMVVAQYPLIGSIVGRVEEAIIVDLGKNHGVKNGDRLFVARKQALIGEDGKVLFQELQRMGTLEVVSSQSTMSKTREKQRKSDAKAFMKGDLVSPDPIPLREPRISMEPLLRNVKKGKMLLFDNMEEKLFLSVQEGMGESYRDGRLHMNASHKNSGHTYCYYPAPFDQLENLVWEGEIGFLKTPAQYSRFDLVFRSTRDYFTLDAYMFFFNNDGGYAVSLVRLGKYFTIVPFSSTPLLNRGARVNKFRIVAYEEKFDIYLNEQFLVGFEDERIEKGTIGFQAHGGTYAAVDNVRIWEGIKE